MVQIVVTPDQAKVLSEAKDSVEIVDLHGNRLGFFARPFSKPDIVIALARAASNEPVCEANRPAITPGTGDWSALEAVANELEGYDFDAWRKERDFDKLHAEERVL